MVDRVYNTWKDVAAIVFPSAEDMEENVILPTGTWMDSSFNMKNDFPTFRPSLISRDSIMLVNENLEEDTTNISDTCTWIDEIPA